MQLRIMSIPVEKKETLTYNQKTQYLIITKYLKHGITHLAENFEPICCVLDARFIRTDTLSAWLSVRQSFRLFRFSSQFRLNEIR
jgi:hypothetical protein